MRDPIGDDISIESSKTFGFKLSKLLLSKLWSAVPNSLIFGAANMELFLVSHLLSAFLNQNIHQNMVKLMANTTRQVGVFGKHSWSLSEGPPHGFTGRV